jgi:hypothetical protein
MKTAVTIVFGLGLVCTTASAADGDGRYQFGGTDMLRVIDTRTGAIWQAKTDAKGSYIMVPVPFQSADGKSTTFSPSTAPRADDPLGIRGSAKPNLSGSP